MQYAEIEYIYVRSTLRQPRVSLFFSSFTIQREQRCAQSRQFGLSLGRGDSDVCRLLNNYFLNILLTSIHDSFLNVIRYRTLLEKN